jgi:hypothetical protein
VLTAIGLTAGEAFVVVFLAGFIITAHYWPRIGAKLVVFIAKRHQARPDK